MSTIDDKVVSMSFDNASFEKRVADTIKSLDELKKSLDFSKSQKGLEDLTRSAKNFNMAGMTGAIENVSKSFIALSTIGITALSKITSAALNTGTQLVKAFSFEPVRQGFQEYETNMNSIQTILANTDSKGTTLDEVNSALKQLNEYSDRTIYNFAQMARNIGTFTAAGVDLDASVGSIKGIANLAAISGSSSEQASTAMYQLSQALAAGTVKLMDWNSVVNAGMGGEVFKKALFETGKALGTIADVPIDTTFEQWEASGKTFRETLQDGWITAEVLTNTLQSFTGDLDAAQLKALGYTEAQAVEMMRLGKLGNAAATEVKTLTQLLGTVKESVASGWSESFKLIFGNFNEAKDLFTSVNDAIGAFVSKQADARNTILQVWRDSGGRSVAIDALRNSFYALGKVVGTIKNAFRSVFPKVTGERLFELTQAFALFAQKIIPSQELLDKLGSGFRGIFYAVKIAITVFKEVIGVFGDLFGALSDDGIFDKLLNGFDKFGQLMSDLYVSLLITEAIPEFFDKITFAIEEPRKAIKKLQEDIKAFFDGTSDGGEEGTLSKTFDAMQERFEGFSTVLSKLNIVWQGFLSGLQGVWTKLQEIWAQIKEWFSSFAENVSEAIGTGDFDKVLDVINTGLLAGIGLLLANFVKNGIDINFGKDIGNKIGELLDGVTGALAAMQAKLQSDTLSKIAIAIGVLAAAVLVLSLIDSAALTKALAAMSVGFGQLVGAMFALAKISGTAGLVSMGGMAAGLVLVAGAMLLLAISVKILSTIGWEDLVKGIAGVGLTLAAVAAAMQLMPKTLPITAAGLIAVGVSMNLLAVAMKIFATMTWEELLKGLLGVGYSLAAIAAAMQLMPKTLPITAAGLIAVGISLNLIAAAMKIYATMSWEEMLKGLLGVGYSLAAIAAAMQLMPKTLPITAAGLVAVGASLLLISVAMKVFASMSWEEMGRGLAGMAASLLALSLAVNTMNGAIGGAIALGIVSVALLALAAALKVLGGLGIAQIITGLVAVVAMLTIIGVAAALMTPVIPVILALGIAMLALGAAFALIGAGAALAALAFATLAGIAGSAMIALIKGIGIFIAALPGFLVGLVKAVATLLETLIAYSPTFFEFIETTIRGMLDTIRKLIPDFVETGVLLITELLMALVELAPVVIETGLALLMALLQGIGDNMFEIVDAAVFILTEFLRGISENLQSIIDGGKEIVISFIKGMSGAYVDIISAGADALIAFLQGISDNVLKVIDAGFQIVIDFLNGLAASIEANRGALAAAGLNVLDAIFGGVLSKAVEVIAWFAALPASVATAIGDVFTDLFNKGVDILEEVWEGAKEGFKTLKTWVGQLPGRIASAIGSTLTSLYDAGVDLIIGLWNGIKNKAGQWLKDKLGWLTDIIPGWVKDALGISSPSKVFAEIGTHIPEGLAVGIAKTAPMIKDSMYMLASTASAAFKPDEKELTNNMVSSVSRAMNKFVDEIGTINDFSPTITPVLDLTNVQRDAKSIGGLIGTGSIGASLSYSEARTISTIRSEDASSTQEVAAVPSVISFEQHNHSPKALSTADIYRQSRNLVKMAKQELEIP